VQAGSVAQRVVATDRNQAVDLQVRQDPEDVGRQIDEPGLRIGRRVLLLEKGRQLARLDVGWTSARRVQEGAARAVDLAHDGLVQPHHPAPILGRVVRVDIERARPSAAEADYFHAIIDGPVHNGFDAGIEARHVTAAGEDAEGFNGCHEMFSCEVLTRRRGITITCADQ
jgi:hypothetical protein